MYTICKREPSHFRLSKKSKPTLGKYVEEKEISFCWQEWV